MNYQKKADKLKNKLFLQFFKKNNKITKIFLF